jgi:DNA-binding CsgD family transcriptional regulator
LEENKATTEEGDAPQEVAIVEEGKTDSILVQYIKQRTLNHNKNFVCITVGSTGSGKSYANLRLAQQIDPSFSVDKVCFTAKQFMDCVNDIIALDEQGIKMRGKVIIWDEFGVEHSAREFMTKSNRVINYFFQTSRHLNLVILMSVPILSFIDTNTRKLCHCVIEMRSINHNTKTATAKVKMLQTNVLSGKEYTKNLRYKRGNIRGKLAKSRFSLPTKELINSYEIKKKQFTTQLNKEIYEALTIEKGKSNGIRQTMTTKPLTKRQEDIINMLKERSVKETAKTMGMNEKTIYQTLQIVRDKEYITTPIWDNKKVIKWKIFKDGDSDDDDK